MIESQKTQIAKNMDAHLIVLREEIFRESQTLSNLLEEGRNVWADIKQREEYATQISDRVAVELATLNQERTKFREEVAIESRKINENIEEFALYEAEVSHRNKKALDEIKEKENRIGVLTDELNTHRLEVESDVTLYENQITELQRTLEAGLTTLTDLRSKNRDLDFSNKTLEVSAQAKKVTLDEVTKELVTLQAQVREEGTKIASAYAGLYVKEAEIDKRDKNFAILKGRFAKAFALLYPGQNLDNLI